MELPKICQLHDNIYFVTTSQSIQTQYVMLLHGTLNDNVHFLSRIVLKQFEIDVSVNRKPTERRDWALNLNYFLLRGDPIAGKLIFCH
jgi:hypothetical protein